MFKYTYLNKHRIIDDGNNLLKINHCKLIR